MLDSRAKVVTFDKPHRIKRTPVCVLPESIHGNNSRMFKSTGDSSFRLKSLLQFTLIGTFLADFLQRNVAIEFHIFGNEDIADATRGVLL